MRASLALFHYNRVTVMIAQAVLCTPAYEAAKEKGSAGVGKLSCSANASNNAWKSCDEITKQQ
jgi:hypothetical protein